MFTEKVEKKFRKLCTVMLSGILSPLEWACWKTLSKYNRLSALLLERFETDYMIKGLSNVPLIAPVTANASIYWTESTESDSVELMVWS